MVTCQSADQLKHLQRIPEPSKWSLSLVHWATQSWGRLLIWQLSRRQSLTLFTRRVSHKHSLPKKLAVHKVLYPSMLTGSWVEGKSVEGYTINQENRNLMRIVKQNRFKNLGELHKEWTQAGVKASRATTHRRVKEFGYSCHQRHLTWAKEKNNCCPVVQSPLFRWEQVLYFIWKPRS